MAADGLTQGHSIYPVSIASHGKNYTYHITGTITYSKSISNQEIGLGNISEMTYFCVEWDVKP